MLRAFERRARVVAVGNLLADRRDLLVRRRLLVPAAVDAELRFHLSQRALRAIHRELQLARLQADEDIAGLHLGAELDAHLADDAGDFAADLRHVRREQGARELDLALHRHALHVRGLNRDRDAATTAASATTLTAGGGLPIRLLTRGGGERECRDHHETSMHFLEFLYAPGARILLCPHAGHYATTLAPAPDDCR